MTSPHLHRGSLLYQQGRYREAIAELRSQLGATPDDSLVHSLLALSLSQLDEHSDATQHAERAIHLAPDQPLAHHALAHVLYRRHRPDEAHAAICEAIRMDPFDPDYFGMLASIELQRGRWRDMLAAADQGLALDPEHGLCTNLRAQALVKLGDRAGAAATIGEALARRPDDALTHANQGWALLHDRQPEKALEHFREALRLEPNSEWARAGIVEALKARHFVYRWMLTWFLWMARLDGRVRWGLVIGALFGVRIVRGIADSSPQLAPLLWPLLCAYFGFVLLTWLSPSFFNLLLRLDRFGRHVLSQDEIRGANVLAGCLLVTLLLLGTFFATGVETLLFAAVLMAVLSLPASVIYSCDSGWPRQTMVGITLALAGALLLVIVVDLVPASALPPQVLLASSATARLLPLALLASQFAANYLVSVKPKK